MLPITLQDEKSIKLLTTSFTWSASFEPHPQLTVCTIVVIKDRTWPSMCSLVVVPLGYKLEVLSSSSLVFKWCMVDGWANITCSLLCRKLG